mgnify:CR=1 FL=1
MSGLMLCLVAGCGADNNGDPAATGEGGWSISAGTYGNVVAGQAGGFEMTLDRGSESAAVDFVQCEDRCADVENRSLRRGLNGVSFSLYREGRVVDVLVTPAGKDAVELSLDQGQGLESHRLPRIDREVGLAIARGKADGTAVPSADTP